MLTVSAALIRGAELATPTPSMTVEPDAVTPTFVGFGFTALVAIVAVLLVVDMLRRIRRAGYRAEVNEQLDAEAQAEAAETATDVDDQDIDDQDIDDQDIDPEADRTRR